MTQVANGSDGGVLTENMEKNDRAPPSCPVPDASQSIDINGNFGSPIK